MVKLMIIFFPLPPKSSPMFQGCVNELPRDRTPSPTFSTSDSEITELADERPSEADDYDDEAFVDDGSSDVGTEEEEEEEEEEGPDMCSDGQDPFYDRSPWFILVGRLVRSTRVGGFNSILFV